MKKLMVLLLMFLPLLITSQNEDRFTFSIYTEPQIYKQDGFNIGGAIEYQMQWVYIKAQTFYYPDLRGITYHDIEGVVGINYRNFSQRVRLYSGVKLGAINREGWGHPKWGFEGGIEYYFRTFYVGTQFSYNRRTDGRVWEADAEPYWTKDAGVKIGIYW
jgi:hypothetical protein